MAKKNKVQDVKQERVYVSIILNTGMEYMCIADKGWQNLTDSVERTTVGFETLDGNPIIFALNNVTIIREITDEEYEVWKKTLEDYRNEQIKKAESQEQVEIENLTV